MTDATAQSARTGISSALLVLISIAAIIRIFAEVPLSIWVELFGLIGFFALEFSRVTKMARFLFVLCLALVVLEYLSGTMDADVTLIAISRAAFMAFFLCSLGFLQQAAGRSPLLLNSGHILVHQPPGRRYLVLSFGAALFGMLLNLSTIGLLGTMIRKGSEGATGAEAQRIAAIRRKRMSLAMLRGFGTIPMWSPLTVTIALISAAIPGLTWVQIAPYSAPLAVCFILVGWVIDRRSHPRPIHHTQQHAPPLNGLLPLLLLVVAVPATAFAFSAILGTSMIVALLIALPTLSVVWIFIQEQGRPEAAASTLKVINGQVLPSLPDLRSEIMLFSCSAFLGVLVADIVDTQALGQVIQNLGLSSGGALTITAWLIVALSLLGLNPIVTVTIAAGTLPQITDPAISPVAVGVMLVSVWTITVNLTPFGTSVRLAARMIDVTPETLGPKWNGLFALSTLCMLSVTLLLFG